MFILNEGLQSSNTGRVGIITLEELLTILKNYWYIVGPVLVGIIALFWRYIGWRGKMKDNFPRYKIKYDVLFHTDKIKHHTEGFITIPLTKPKTYRVDFIELIRQGNTSAVPITLTVATPNHPEEIAITNLLWGDKMTVVIDLMDNMPADKKHLIRDEKEILIGFKYEFRGKVLWSKEHFIREKNKSPKSSNINEYYIEGKSPHFAGVGNWFLKSNKIKKRWIKLHKEGAK